MLSPSRNIVMVCSVVVFCAAVMGCSSSGDGAPADMTVEMPPEEMPPEEQPPAPPMPSEEDLGLMAAVHTMVQDNWSGNVQAASWSGDSATWFQSSPKHGAAFFSAPWRNMNGELEFAVIVGTFVEQGREVQTTPVIVNAGRQINTSLRGDEPPGFVTTTREIQDHALGSGWQGIEATKTYDGGGQLMVEFYTDADASDILAQALQREASPHRFGFDGILPLPPGRDYQYFFLPDAGLSGTLDGTPGIFRCGQSLCGFGTSSAGPDSYDPIASEVVFTPDDGSPDVPLTPPRTHRRSRRRLCQPRQLAIHAGRIVGCRRLRVRRVCHRRRPVRCQ